MIRKNEYGQPIGDVVAKSMAQEIPEEVLSGIHCDIVLADPDRYAGALHEQMRSAPDDRDWTYMGVGPFDTVAAYRDYLRLLGNTPYQKYFAILEKSTGLPVGTAALMRQDAAHGVIEVGNIMYSRRLQRTRAGTEAIYLLMKRVFTEMGYRRLEWKCDALNAASRRAALRYGFKYEGIFRQAVVYKGRNRDTAWFSIIDTEWPVIHECFRKWLAADNFDADGKQIIRLSEYMHN